MVRDWLIPLGAAFIVIPLIGWIGVVSGRYAAKKNPAMAASLWMLMAFFKVDPPPPPKAERVVRDEGAAGDPPKT